MLKKDQGDPISFDINCKSREEVGNAFLIWSVK
jgi:hypothetical protein